MGGVVAGFFATEIREGELLVISGAASFLLEHMRHQKSRGVPDRRRLAEPLMAPGHNLPARTDQITAQGGDELLADLSGGGHGVRELPIAEAIADSWCAAAAGTAGSRPRPADG
jgi:hypothetical protein